MYVKVADNDSSGVASYANQNDVGKALASIVGLLRESDNILPILRSEFKGEATIQYDDGSVENVQISKPMFIQLDFVTNQPIKIMMKYRSGEKEIYVSNDDAIEHVLSMLKFMGLNKITALTNLNEKTILEDLREFECKLAAVLMLKQKEWGIDKELLPTTMTKIKTIIQDARYMCCNGSTIKAIQKTVQRIESYSEGTRPGRGSGPYA